MTPQTILDSIRTLATDNGGRPLGERAFYAASGISRTDLWNAGFARYGDAVQAAGLVPNQLVSARSSAEMMPPLARLVREIGRFPSISDIKARRASEPDLPSYEAFFRLSGGSISRLPSMLLDFCREKPGYEDVADILNSTIGQTTSRTNAPARSNRVSGFVYLAKHGRDYKIGRSNDVTRRRREVALLLPEELKHVHVIETDDPEGIEQYWHRRFASRRVRGEWFRLTPDDVAAFKRRRYQ